MKKSYKLIVMFLMAGLSSMTILAQQNITITGTVKSSVNAEVVPAVSVLVKGKTTGTFTDDRGNFRITTNASLPLTLVFSSVGFADKELSVSSATSSVSVNLDPVNALAQDVVVSASRVAERILESPVSIERINSAGVRNTAQSNYYDMIGNLKGVDLVTSSLLFKTPSTRGFNTSGNLRLNQLVDGMDNQAPGLNFAVGSLVGLTELDVDNIELLGGASSALYGPGGMNGTLLITGKNPFKYQGLSWQVKQGVTHTDRRQRNASPYFDWTLRYAKQVSDKFAFKIGGQFVQTRDWIGTDNSNYTQSQTPISGRKLPGNRNSDPNYNGVNVYGDETTANLRSALVGLASTTPALAAVNLPGFGIVPIPTSIALSPFTAGATFDVSRTGYREAEILDPTTQNVKLSGSLNYKITEGIEASFTGHFGLGTTVYTGSDRYSLKGVKIGQYKLEVNHRNWFVRGYTTQEDAGESFNATVTTRLFNEVWKPSQTVWYPQFIGALVGGSANAYGAALGAAYAAALGQGQTPAQAAATAQAAAPNGVAANKQNILVAARAAADVGRPAPGSAQFISIFDQVRSKPISQGGGLFFDKTNLYMTEGQYNFTEAVKFAEVLVGANYKQYVLNSQGTLFADTAGRIKINEVGTYALISKKFFKDVLKLTASGRYDKNSNFSGKFTPRFSAVVKVAKDNNIRLSYQTAYRFPSTQNQWINLVIGGGVRLIGGLPALRTHYGFNTNPVYTPQSAAIFGASAQGGVINPGLLKVQNFEEYKPEQATSYEVGYKGLITPKLLFDVYAYYTKYENFIGRIAVVQSKTGTPLGLLTQPPNIFSVSVNSPGKVNTQGWGTSIEYLLGNNFVFTGNFYTDEIKNVPTNFIAGFNTPKVRTNIGLGNTGLFMKKRLGFNVVYKYQDDMKYESDFGSGTIPSFSTVDAQVNYKLPKTKSMVKVGATNLLNKYYLNAFGNPEIGGLYYVSFGYNIF
jgi:outer membrane receptor for ferrienterochelin and colicin